MKKLYTKFFPAFFLSLLLPLLLSFFVFFKANAANVNAVTSGNWNTGSTWSGGSVPLAGDVITINTGVNVTISTDLSATVYTSTLTIAGTGTLTIEANGIFSRTTGTVTFNGSGSGAFNIYGVYYTTSTAIPTFTNTIARLRTFAGGIISNTAAGNGGSIFGTSASTNIVWDEGAIFELNGGNNNWNNTTFFPNNTSSTTTWPILRLTAVSTLNSGVTGITINGILHINSSGAASSVNTAAIKMTIRGGVQADYAIVTSSASTYPLTITGVNAILSGSGGISTSSNGAGVVISSGASVTVTGNTSLGTDTIYGTLTINNLVSLSMSQTSTLTGSAWVISNNGSLNFNNLRIAATPSTQPTTNFSIGGTLTVLSGQTLTPTAGTITFNASTSAISNNGTLQFYNLTIATTPTAQSQYNSSYSIANALTVNTGVTFSPSGGTITLTGNAINNNSATSINFFNLTINSGATTTLSGSANIVGTLTLQNGILDVGIQSPSRLNLGSTGTVSGTFSSTNFINGSLTKTMASGTAFTFPVGQNNAYLPFTISTVGTPTLTIIPTNGDIGANAVFDDLSFSSISHSEYWQLIQNSGSFSSATVGLGRFNGIGANNTIAFSNNQSGTFYYEGGTVSGNNINNSQTINGEGYFVSAVGNANPSSYLVNPGFETLPTATSIFYTGNGTINNTLAWQWQTSFVSGTSSGSAVIVDTVKYSGNKSLQLTINSHTNRNDIKLIQVIGNVAVPPAGKCILSFYLKSARNGDSVTANIFKSTAANNSNGAVGDKNQPAQLFIATKEWQKCKMYVDLSSWSLAERTNMRVSIRPNTSNLTPSGPYPKTYWFDDLTFTKYDTLNELKDIAILVAENRRKVALDSGFTNEVASLDTAIINLKNRALSYPVTPTRAIGFYPPPLITDTSNPYIKQMNVWAATYITSSFSTFPKSTVGNIVFGGSFDARELGTETEYLVWLLTSPYSNYRYDPELFRRFLTIVYATSDDYQLNGKELSGIPGSTDNTINDWFAAPKTVYAWWMAELMFSDYMPTILKQRLRDAADSMGKYHYTFGQGIDEYIYANRDVSYAEILMQAGLYRNNNTWINQAKRMVDSLYKSALLPDGAYLYRKQQNEVTNYHGGNNNSLAKMWVMSGYQPAWDCIAKAANYEILSIEPKDVGEFYTAAVWKQQWNASSGYSAEPLLAITQNKYLKTKYNELYRVNGYENQIALSLAFYNPNIDSLPLPDDYVVYDRNIQGPRCRNGRFSYGASLRKVVTDAAEPGMQTFVGAMVTQPDANNPGDGINSVLQAVQSKVHVRNPTLTEEWTNWGYMMSKTDPRVVVARKVAAFSSPSVLQYQTSGPTGWETNWASNQHWITLDDRLFGFVETFPKNATGTTPAEEIEGRVKFTYGRNSTYPLDEKRFVIDTPNKQYTYGKLRTIVHGHDFTSIDTVTAAVLRDFAPFNSSEIKFKYDLSNGTSLYNYPASTKKYFMIEVKHTEAVGNATVSKVNLNNGKISGLIVKLNGNGYASYRNDSSVALTIDISNVIVAGNITEAHFSRNDTIVKQPQTITTNQLTIPAKEQVLVISTNTLSELGNGWSNYTETLVNNGVFPSIDSTVYTGVGGTNWNTFNNWSYGVPTNTSKAIIKATTNKPILTNIETIKKLQVDNNALLSLQNKLNVTDSVVINGTIAGIGNINLSGITQQKISGNGLIHNLQLSNSAGAVIQSGNHQLSILGLLQLNQGTLITNDNLTLKSNENNTASIPTIPNGASLSGKLLIERFIPAKNLRRFSFIGSPVEGNIQSNWQQQIFITGTGNGGSVCGTRNSNGFDVTQSNAPSMFTYSPVKVNNNRWVSIPNTTNTNVIPGIGYRINIRGSKTNGGGCANQLNSASPSSPDSVTLKILGNYTSNPTVNVYGTNSYMGGASSFTLIANPFPCAISAQSFLNANADRITHNVWMYAHRGNNTNNYGAWNKTTRINTGFWPTDYNTDNTTDLIIPSGSAFFVERTSATDTTVVFNEGMKVGSPKNGTSIFGQPTVYNNSIRLKLTKLDTSVLNDAVLLFINDPESSNNSYTKFDTRAINLDSPFSISIKKAGYSLALATFQTPLLITDTISLVLQATAGSYRLQASDFANLNINATILLYDKFLNSTQIITQQPFYDFNVTTNTASFGEDRFKLILKYTTPLAISNNIVLQSKLYGDQVKLSWNAPINVATSTMEYSKGNEIFKPYPVNRMNNGAENYCFVPASIEREGYYRVKSVLLNGSIIYSNTVFLKRNSGVNKSINVYPNPAKEVLHIANLGNSEALWQLEIVDIKGAKKLSRQLMSDNNGNISLPIYELANGSYILRIFKAQKEAEAIHLLFSKQ